VDSSRRVDLHAFVELGVQVGSTLCSYGSPGQQPRGMASYQPADRGQPLQKVMAERGREKAGTWLLIEISRRTPHFYKFGIMCNINTT
jgi:hypothetical protein